MNAGEGLFAADGAAFGGVFDLTRLDPACKLAALLLFSLAVALLRNPFWAALALAASALLCLAGRLPARKLLRQLAFANIFLIFLWIFLPLRLGEAPLGPADVLLRVGPFSFTRSGLALALLITLKSNAAIIATLALAGTSSFAANGHAMRRLKVPEKAALLFLLTQRHLYSLGEELEKLNRAARLRGFQPGSSLRAYRVQAWLLGRLLLRSWNKAERVNNAMRLRGFCGKFPFINPVALNAAELRRSRVFLAGAACFSITLFVVDILKLIP